MKIHPEWKSGWPVVGACAIAMGTGLGLYTMVASLFIQPLEAAFGWSRGDIAKAGASALLASFALPLIGLILDRYGAKKVAALGLIGLALAYLMLSQLSGSLMIFSLIIFVFTATGLTTGPIVYTQLINRGFNQHRGLALGITLSGATVSSMIFIPVLALLIESYGWRAGYGFLAALPLLIGLPIILLGIKSKQVLPRTKLEDTQEIKPASSLSFRTLFRDLRFWLLGLGLIVANIGVGGMLSQQQPMLLGMGFETADAATLGSIFAASIGLGRLASGWSLDHFWPPLVAAIFLWAPLLGVMLMLNMAQPSYMLAMIAVASFGLAQGAEVDFLAFLVPRYFGVSNYGKVFGLLAMGQSISMAFGAISFGILYDQAGSYELAFKLSLGTYLLGGLAVLGSGYREYQNGYGQVYANESSATK